MADRCPDHGRLVSGLVGVEDQEEVTKLVLTANSALRIWSDVFTDRGSLGHLPVGYDRDRTVISAHDEQSIAVYVETTERFGLAKPVLVRYYVRWEFELSKHDSIRHRIFVKTLERRLIAEPWHPGEDQYAICGEDEIRAALAAAEMRSAQRERKMVRI